MVNGVQGRRKTKDEDEQRIEQIAKVCKDSMRRGLTMDEMEVLRVGYYLGKDDATRELYDELSE